MRELVDYKKAELKYEMDLRKGKDDLVPAHVHMISRTVPARLENGIVINYLRYSQLMKKLKKFTVNEKLRKDKLVILYHDQNIRGSFEFYDMSKHYEGMAFIPEALEVQPVEN